MVDVETLRSALRLTHAPVVMAGLAETIAFFRDVVQDDPIRWVEMLQGIDFHKAVNRVDLERHTPLVRYEYADDGREVRELKPFAFFTDPGVSPYHLGVSWPAWNYRLFNVTLSTPALVSIASDISFAMRVEREAGRTKARFDRVSRAGGGVQYIISRRHWPTLLRVGATRRV